MHETNLILGLCRNSRYGKRIVCISCVQKLDKFQLCHIVKPFGNSNSKVPTPLDNEICSKLCPESLRVY